MRRNLLLTVGFSCCLVLAVLPANAQQGASPDDGDKELRQAAVQAKNSSEAGKALSRLFQDVDPEALRARMCDPNATIALRAAWQVSQSSNGLSGRCQPQRFIGFLEGRAECTLPKRWEVRLVDVALREHSDLHDEAMESYLPKAPFLTKVNGRIRYSPDHFKDSGFGIAVPSDTTLRMQEDTTQIVIGQRTLLFRTELLQPLRSGPSGFDRLRADLGPQVSYIAVYNQFGDAFPLLCLDSRSGTLLWQSVVWGLGAEKLGGKFGAWWHDLEFSRSEKAVSLFGDGGLGCYYERFDAATGNALGRFSTNNWDPD